MTTTAMIEKMVADLGKINSKESKSLENSSMKMVSTYSNSSKDQMFSSVHPIAPGENGALLNPKDGNAYLINSPDGENAFTLDEESRICVSVEDALKKGWIPVDVKSQLLNQTKKIHVDTFNNVDKVYDLGQLVATRKNSAQLKHEDAIKTVLNENAEKEVSIIDTTTFSATQKMTANGFKETHSLKFGFTVEKGEESVKAGKRTIKKGWLANIKMVKAYYTETLTISDGVTSYAVEIKNSLKGKDGKWESCTTMSKKNGMDEILFPDEMYFNGMSDDFVEKSWKTASNIAVDVLYHQLNLGSLNDFQNLVGTHPIEAFSNIK